MDIEYKAQSRSGGRVTHVGGSMYGDGVYVVEFENVGSTQAPLVACVIGPNVSASVRFDAAQRPSVRLAEIAIALVVRAERS